MIDIQPQLICKQYLVFGHALAVLMNQLSRVREKLVLKTRIKIQVYNCVIFKVTCHPHKPEISVQDSGEKYDISTIKLQDNDKNEFRENE